MKWFRDIDYHGSRSYGADEPPARMFSLAIGWLGGIVKSKLRSLRARPTARIVLLQDGQHGFSLLGAKSGPTGECPFPVKPHAPDRDWRVYP